MGIFNRNKIGIKLTEGQKIIYKYIVAHTQGGVSLEQTRINLENHKEKGNYTTEDINQALAFLEKQSLPTIKKPKKIISKDHISVDMKKEIKKLPRKQRKNAIKLLEMYNKGQILKPDGITDNKKHILEGEK